MDDQTPNIAEELAAAGATPDVAPDGEEPIDPRDAKIAELTQEVSSLRAECDLLKDQHLRAVAEARNIQQRMRQEMEASRRYATESLVLELLPALDNFERTIQAAEKGASVDKLLQGVKSIDKQLRRALESVQVRRIEAVGQAFDPNLHDALEVHESDEHEPDTVTTEIQPGYRMGDKVIRPARVRVAGTPE